MNLPMVPDIAYVYLGPAFIGDPAYIRSFTVGLCAPSVV